jgi:transketolase
MVLYEAMAKQFELTGDKKYYVDPKISIRGIDSIGFRRTQEAVSKILEQNGLQDHPNFKEYKGRGIRALMGHSETTDVTNDVNGGPSGIGVAGGPGRALFWDIFQAPESMKVIAFEGEFAFTEGHAQELKTLALAQKVGKRFRLYFSDNNAGIDDAMIGGVIDKQYASQYDYANQFYSYGWNVFEVENGGDYKQVASAFKKMEEWPATDKRPMVVISRTIKGWWPASKDGKIGSLEQIIGYKSHPYGFKMNSEYFVALAQTFEERYGVKFVGIRDGVPKTEKDRILQLKTNMDICMSVMDKKAGLREWICNRLLYLATTVNTGFDKLAFNPNVNPFKDPRLRVENIPMNPVSLTLKHPNSGAEIKRTIALFEDAGKKWGARRAISEIGAWINYVTDNRFFTIAADLSNSINLEAINLTGHYDPDKNNRGTRLKAGIQECVNAATICGLTSQTISTNPEEHSGVWGITGTYGAFTPLMYLPLRIHSQQNQDSPFALGVATIVAGHSGPETAADARSHFGIYSPQVWNLFPRGHIINLHFWDYNDCAPGYFAAVQYALARKETGIIVIHVARPDFAVADRTKFADSDIKAAAKGCYIIREYNPYQPPLGTIFVQGTCSTFNTVSNLERFDKEKLNVRIISVVSEDLFRFQPVEYQKKIIPDNARIDAMIISTMSKRMPPIANLGPLTEEYSLYPDYDDRWRTGGSEDDIISEAHLDKESVYQAIKKFAKERPDRIKRQVAAFSTTLHPASKM